MPRPVAPARAQTVRAVTLVLMLAACSRTNDAATTPRVDLTGAGATFPYPLYRAWFSEYGARANVRINYFSVGSAEGLRLLAQGDADFGATDRPLQPELARTAKGCARIAIPTVIGPIAVAYHLPSSANSASPLHFDAALLADIYSGRVTRWNAREVRLLNPDVTLPATTITVVHRASGSGTGRAFSDFLATSGRWAGGHGGDSVDAPWPVGVAAEGNEGVASEVKVTLGAIGFMELAYARQNRLRIGAVKTAGGGFLLPGRGATAYPITARTWLVIDPTHVSTERGEMLASFIRWALHDGAEQAIALEYTPLPADTVAHYDSLLRALTFGKCAVRDTAHLRPAAIRPGAIAGAASARVAASGRAP